MDIKHFIELANIKTGKKEEGEMKKEIAGMLESVSRLDETDAPGAEPLFNISGLRNVYRQDEAGEQSVAPQKIMETAPQKERGFVKAPLIFE